MRANEFIVEAPQAIDYYNMQDRLEQVANRIKAECQPFIQANWDAIYSGDFLFRGIKTPNSIPEIVKDATKTSRSPRDSSIYWHRTFDKFFQINFGWSYRSASVFACGEKHLTAEYGTPYAIFPIGEYKLCYSPKVVDATQDISRLLSAFIRRLPNDEPFLEKLNNKYGLGIQTTQDLVVMSHKYTFSDGTVCPPSFTAFIVDHFLPTLGYVESDTYADEVGDSEVMVQCSGYYGLCMQADRTWEENLNKVLRVITS